jgi:hypothetical protein
MRVRLAVLAWSGPPVNGRCSRLQLMRAVRAVWGAWLPQIYKSKEREGEVPYLVT